MKLRLLTLLFIIISLIVACAPNNNNADATIENVYYFSGTIIKIGKNNTAIVNIEEGGILSSGSEVVVDLSVEKENSFIEGDKIKVGYDGIIRESMPLGINTISVQLIE